MSTDTDTTTERTDSTTSDIDKLREEIDQLHRELASARQRITALEDRIQSSSTSSLPSAASDWRDARILEALEPGDIVSLREFRNLVEARTDIRASEKISDRIGGLVKTDTFERVSSQSWRYRGPAGGQ